MESNADTVEGFGRNTGEDDCMLNCLPEIKTVYHEHFKPSQDMLSSVLQHSRSHFKALAGRESFAGLLNVPLISDILAKSIEDMFKAAKPCVVRLQNDEASANISWLDVVKERNYQAEYEGNGIYHFHMQGKGVIIRLSTFQHNVILSGLPRKLVQPWSYEKDVRTELNTLALAAEMTSLLNELASEVIKVNNTVLEEIVRRDQILRRNLQSSQRSAGSPFPPESAEFPANSTPAPGGTASLDMMAIETQNTDVKASASKRGAGATKNFSKNRVWPSGVLKELPKWFEDQVLKELSQEEIAQNFHRRFKQKRTFQAIEAKVYYLTGKSPFRKRAKKTSGKTPVSLTSRSSPPPSQPSESVSQQLMTRSNIEVQALHLAPKLLPYLSSEGHEEGNLYTLHGVQTIDPESRSSNSHAVLGQESPTQVSSCLRNSQERVLQPGQRQSECSVRRPQAGESSKAHAAIPDIVPGTQPRNENSINVLAATSATSGTVDPYLPRNSLLGSPRISRPIQSPICHHSEDDNTYELGQTLPHRIDTSAMHVERTDTAHDKPSGRLSPRTPSRESPLARGSANENSNNERHTESGPAMLTVPRESTPFQVHEPSSAGNSTEHHSGDCRTDGPIPNTSGFLFDEELIKRCRDEKSQAKATRSHRPWNERHLNRLPEWYLKRKSLPKEKLEVEFLRDFGHYRTFSAIVTACRKKIKAASRHEETTSAPSLGQLAPVVSVDITRVSRSPNAIIGSGNPSLNSSHITEPNISEMAPLVQMESNERDTAPGGQGVQQTPTKSIVEQRSDDQNVSQQEGPQRKLSSSNVVFAIAIRPFEACQICICYLTFFSLFFLYLSLLLALTAFIRSCRCQLLRAVH
ncbi:unnamed protein product [Penicillium nalgiovense]|nr:unnamed protein product [Penicillium nalgiovense]